MKMQATPAEAQLVIYRQVTFSVEAFDRLKDWQRHWEAREGCQLTNGAVLDRLILANPRPAAR